MMENAEAVNVQEIAPLVNVGLMLAATQRTMARPRHLPGLVAYYGPAGWGKTFAACFVANQLDCYHVQILPFWNRSEFLRQVCIELGVKPERPTISGMGAAICTTLGMSQKPLIIDEADLAIKRGFIDDIRGFFEGSKTTIVIIGEETLPNDLLKWERFHSRVFEWVPAQAPDLQDAATLAARFGRVAGITIADDLVAEIHAKSGASVRRICTNIERVLECAREEGVAAIDLAAWKRTGRHCYTGSAPVRGIARQAA